MPHTDIVTRLRAISDFCEFPSAEFFAVESLIADIEKAALPPFDEAAWLADLETQWEAQQALMGHDAADRYMFAV